MLWTTLIAVIVIALFFDFTNGFHDTANSIATVIATRVLSPRQAILMAVVLNFAGALSGTAVAATVGKGIVDPKAVTQVVIAAALASAIAWNFVTWYFGIPSSSSHALIGGLVGAGMAFQGSGILNGPGLEAVVLSLLVSPVLGFIFGFILMIVIIWIVFRQSPHVVNEHFRRLQLLSSAFMSFSHGSNDAQKTMGVITGVLFTSGYLKTFDVPIWVILSAHAAIALGTLSGGWRIVHTMGGRLTRLKPRSGFCAETGAAASVLLSTYMGTPVSTTHAIAGAIAGVGSIQRMKAVRWGIATNIVWAWVLTIPAAATIAWLSYFALHFTIVK